MCSRWTKSSSPTRSTKRTPQLPIVPEGKGRLLMNASRRWFYYYLVTTMCRFKVLRLLSRPRVDLLLRPT